MLTQIRNNARSWVVFVLFGLLILSFAVWGIGDIFRPGISGQTEVAEVGGNGISAQSYMNELRRELNQLQRTRGISLDMSQAKQTGIAGQVLGRMINDALLTQGVNDLGLGVSTATIAEAIRQDRTFQDQFGQFDMTQYQRILANSGLNEARYVELRRAEIAQNQLTSAVAAFERVPEIVVDKIYRHVAEKRVAELLLIPNASMPDPGEPSATALAEFHENNAQRFTAPEYRAATAIIVRPADIAPTIAIPDDRLKAAFEERQHEFATPEKRTVEQILLTDEAKARAAYEELKKGFAFEKVAKDATGRDDAVLRLGALTRKELALPALADAAFALGEGEVSEPVRTDLGWHILRVTDVEPGHMPSFEEARDKLRAELQREAAIDAVYDVVRKLEDELGRGSTLEEAAQSLGFQATKITAVDQSGRDPSGNEVEGLPDGAEFLQQIFEQEVREDGYVTETQGGTVFVARVDAVTPSAVKPLESVRDEVVSGWKNEQRQKAAEKKAAEVAAAVNGGRQLSEIAAEMNLETSETPPLVRAGSDAERDIPGALRPKLFSSKSGQAVAGPAADGQVVAVVKEIVPADPATDQDGVKAVRDQLAQLYQNDLLNGLGAALREEHPVTIDEAALDQLLAQP